MTAAPAAGPAPIDIGPLRRADLPGVLAIERRVYPRPWTEALFLSELALQSSRAYVVARINGAVVGYGGVMLVPPEAHVTTIAVDPGRQRSRIGTALLIELAREAIRRGTASLTLEVRISNRAAQELYRRFGFAPVGVRKGYYADADEDAIVMWVHDIDQAGFSDLLDAHERHLVRQLRVERDPV